jgi:hypothetical protein
MDKPPGVAAATGGRRSIEAVLCGSFDREDERFLILRSAWSAA